MRTTNAPSGTARHWKPKRTRRCKPQPWPPKPPHRRHASGSANSRCRTKCRPSPNARWIEPTRRNGPLRAHARDTETRTLALLDDALTSQAEQPDRVVRERVLNATPTDVETLRPQLEQRAKALAEDALAKLTERGKAEAAQLTAILHRQRDRVIEELAHHDNRQLALNFNADETEQLEADKRRWHRRLAQFDQDLAQEPVRIKAFYEVRARRVGPVGLVYLWPETN